MKKILITASIAVALFVVFVLVSMVIIVDDCASCGKADAPCFANVCRRVTLFDVIFGDD